ncbi:MAG TPA: hypothetical protein PK765_02300 [bacterium]|nr:hypothetical protein [bacterium]
MSMDECCTVFMLRLATLIEFCKLGDKIVRSAELCSLGGSVIIPSWHDLSGIPDSQSVFYGVES